MIDTRSQFFAIRRDHDVAEPLDPEALSILRAELTKVISRTAHIATTLLVQHALREGALIAVQNLQLSLEQLNYFLDCADAEKTS